MTTRKISILALLVIVPASLSAQASGGSGFGKLGAGGAANDANKMIKDMADSPSLSKDLQKANPVEALLDKKKDLKLSADEEKELKTINGALKDATKPYFKTIDSVSREMKKTGDYAPTQGQILIGRKLTRESSDSVMVLYQGAAQQAIGKLTEEHRQPATEALQKEQEAQMAARRGGRPPM